MIQEAYCSFEVAELLKEKGFNESTDKQFFISDKIVGNYNITDRSRNPERYLDNPTHQMAMRWLREVHNIFILIEPHSYNYIEEKNSSYVFSFWQGDNYYENPSLKEYYSYEDAVEAALKYSLKNLI